LGRYYGVKCGLKIVDECSYKIASNDNVGKYPTRL
jgi:hypothetical protein